MTSGLKSFLSCKIKQPLLKGIILSHGKNPKPSPQVNIVLGVRKGACADTCSCT